MIMDIYVTDSTIPAHYFLDQLAEVGMELVTQDVRAFDSLVEATPKPVRGKHGVFFGCNRSRPGQ